ncbi:MAG: acyclic terpene utilization AtuA family protein [Sphingomonadales bacterium]|nr:acyclic terpene utilization AtuA family protein [Sphingomonadales bacterium]
MLAIIGVAAVLTLLALILSNRLAPIAALILVPVVASLLIGQGLQMPGQLIEGITRIAPVAGMFVFAILFFGIMTDVGLLDPLVRLVLRLAGRNPVRIAIGTTLLALVIHLDGSGAVCFLVAIPAMRPLYDALGMDRRILACTASLAAGVNFLPWTGPTLRASAALHIPTTALVMPMLPAQMAGIAFALAAAWWMGRGEARRLALLGGTVGSGEPPPLASEPVRTSEYARPHLLIVNMALTLFVIGVIAVDQLPRREAAARPHRRACSCRSAHGGRAVCRRRVHRDHERFGHAPRDGGDGRASRAGRPGRASAGPARDHGDAAEPAVRPRFLLFRRAAGHRTGRCGVRHAARRHRSGSAARPDDDGISRQPAHPRDLPGLRVERRRSGRAPALRYPLAVRGQHRDAGGGAAAWSIAAVSAGVQKVRIGVGAGFSGDRIEPAIELIERGDLQFLVFECLAERTIALAHQARRLDPSNGFDPLLIERMRGVLPGARRRGVRIITNAGAANPLGAAQALATLARELGLPPLRIAAVLGDDVREQISAMHYPLLDEQGTTADLRGIISANAYLGAEPIAQALALGADVVITGRVGDPALFVGPLAHAFGWRFDDAELIGRATVIGHLLECAGQLTGGYFADGDRKQVEGLARLGFPFAEVSADAGAILGKVAGSGGRLSMATCKEQLLYEILDPAAYHQADVIADFTSVAFEEVGPDRIRVSGGGGRPPSGSLKVSIGYDHGFIG